MGRPRHGFTLVEAIVVLFLISLAAALVAPALFRAYRSEESPLGPLVADARDAAARRAEVLYLHVSADGSWRLRGAASPEQGDLAAGRLSGFQGPPFALVISPIGMCSLDARSGAAAPPVRLDPLTCEVQAR